jgi:hypothetical protein
MLVALALTLGKHISSVHPTMAHAALPRRNQLIAFIAQVQD